MLAQKHSLALAVGLLAMAALAASAGCVARVDLDHGDSRERRLVREEAEKLVERPARQPVASVPTPSRNPFADAFEVFDGNATPGALGGFDDRLADAMVLVLAEPGFLSGQPLQFLLGSLDTLALEPFPLRVVPLTDLLDRPSGVLVSVAVDGNLVYAHVDTDEIRHRNQRAVGNVDRDDQEPLAILLEERYLP